MRSNAVPLRTSHCTIAPPRRFVRFPTLCLSDAVGLALPCLAHSVGLLESLRDSIAMIAAKRTLRAALRSVAVYLGLPRPCRDRRHRGGCGFARRATLVAEGGVSLVLAAFSTAATRSRTNGERGRPRGGFDPVGTLRVEPSFLPRSSTGGASDSSPYPPSSPPALPRPDGLVRVDAIRRRPKHVAHDVRILLVPLMKPDHAPTRRRFEPLAPCGFPVSGGERRSPL